MCSRLKYFCRPRQHPKYFCLSSLMISTVAALIIFIFALNSNIIAKNATAQSDISLLMDAQYDSFGGDGDAAVTHTFVLDTHQYPNTYGVICSESIAGGTGCYYITLEYQVPNTTQKGNCGSLFISNEYP
eukprot:9217_1